MDFTSKTILFTLSLVSLLLNLGNAIPSSRNIHIVHHNLQFDLTELCKKTTNPTLCAQTIQPSLNGGGGASLDTYKALEIEVNATLKQTKKTLGVIDGLLAKQGISKSLKDSLSTCKDQYSSILDSIKETQDAIAKRDCTTAKFKFSAVISYQASCKDAFEGMDSEFSFATDSEAVYQLGGNCLDIIADLEKDVPKPPPVAQAPPSPYSDVIGTVS